MQPTMMAKPRRSASAASASASVRPPVLSSLTLIASYLPASASSEARSCTLSSAQTGIGRFMRASAASRPSGSGCSISVTPAFGAGREILREIVCAPSLIGVDDELGFRRGAPHRRDPLASSASPPPSFTLSKGRPAACCRRLRHRRRRSERNRVGGHQRFRRRKSRQFVARGGRFAWRRDPKRRNRAHCAPRRPASQPAARRGRGPVAAPDACASIAATTPSGVSP